MQKMHCPSGFGLYSQNGVIVGTCLQLRDLMRALKCAKGDQGQEPKSSGDGAGEGIIFVNDRTDAFDLGDQPIIQTKETAPARRSRGRS
jgi:hypothetical protein